MKNLKIGTRLAAGFALVLLLTILMTIVGISHMQTVAGATRDMMQQPLAKERMVSDWYRLIHTSVRRTSAISKSSDASLGAYFAEDTANSTKEVSSLQKQVEALVDSDDEKKLFDELGAARKRYVAARDQIVALKKEGKIEEAEALLQGGFKAGAADYLSGLSKLLEFQRKSIDEKARQIEAVYEHSRTFQIGLGLLVVLLGAACAVYLTRGITIPLQRAVDVAAAVADNDLRSQIHIDSQDETGRLLLALKKMNDGLAGVVSDVRSSAANIASASGEIAAGNLDLSSRTEQQAAALEETASSMEELTSTVKQNADHAVQANKLALEASDVAARGGEVVGKVVDTMGHIDASARRIVDIISVIDGIAFQTNILALNAAVEAARAGEQGRGFAVVATEVRNLAQRSAAAAKEIKDLIGDSVSQVEAGSKLVEQAGFTMSEVVDSIQRVTAIMSEISTASAEQSSGIEQVNRAISEMDGVTQQNAALVEEASAAAVSLQQQADALTTSVSVFKLGDEPRAAFGASGTQRHNALRLAA
jgi:methyl-accepting chemotaxis protein